MIYKKVLDRPLLALSIYFERNRLEYYRLLNEVKTQNNLLDWLKFFLKGIAEASQYTGHTIKEMLRLKAHYESELQKASERRAVNSLKLLEYLFKQPIIKAKEVAQLLSVSYNTAKDLINLFLDLQILQKRQLNKKESVYVFERYLRLFIFVLENGKLN